MVLQNNGIITTKGGGKMSTNKSIGARIRKSRKDQIGLLWLYF